MAAVFQFKGIKPKALDIDGMYGEIMDAANKAADEILAQFEMTVVTWTNPPDFERIVDLDSSGISTLVGTDDRIYKFINDGTSVRHALMSDDWVSKTQPGRMTSRTGSGHVVAVSKKIVRPGIEPRKFDQQIQKDWKKKYKRHMEVAMKNARKASGWAI